MSVENPKNLEANLAMHVINLQSKIQKRAGQPLSLHGIGLSEYLVLDRLQAAPGNKLRRSDLAEQVGLSPSGVTRLLNPMEKIGLIAKEENPRDARVSLVTLTAAGGQVAAETSESFEQAVGTLFKPLDHTQMTTLSDLLRSVLA